MMKDACYGVLPAKCLWKRVSLTCVFKCCLTRSFVNVVRVKGIAPLPLSVADNDAGNTPTTVCGNGRGDLEMRAKNPPALSLASRYRSNHVPL